MNAQPALTLNAPAVDPSTTEKRAMAAIGRSAAMPGNRRLHAILTRGEEGEPVELIIATAYQDTDLLRAMGGGVNMPAEMLPALRRMLEKMDQ